MAFARTITFLQARSWWEPSGPFERPRLGLLSAHRRSDVPGKEAWFEVIFVWAGKNYWKSFYSWMHVKNCQVKCGGICRTSLDGRPCLPWATPGQSCPCTVQDGVPWGSDPHHDHSSTARLLCRSMAQGVRWCCLGTHQVAKIQMIFKLVNDEAEKNDTEISAGSPWWVHTSIQDTDSITVLLRPSQVATGGINSDQRCGPIIRTLRGDIVLMPHQRPRLRCSPTCSNHEMCE